MPGPSPLPGRSSGERRRNARALPVVIDDSPGLPYPVRVDTLTQSSRLRVSDDISNLVGETPMLQMKKLAPRGAADIFAKLEYLNPGGSVKDRAAIGLIERA